MKTVKGTGEVIVVETARFGGRIVIGVCRGLAYVFGKPLPRD